jgi:hypothetical protein
MMVVLVAIALKSVIVAGAALGLLQLMKRRSAAERSWVAHTGLVALVLPALALLAGLLVVAATRRLGRVGVPVASGVTAAVLVALLIALPAGPSSADARYPICQHGARRQAALWLLVRTDPGAAFSMSDSGQVPALAARRKAIDQFMLNDPIIQRRGQRLTVHRRVDLVLDRKPEVIILASTSPSELEPRYPTDAALAKASRFSRHYRLAEVARGGGEGCQYHLFIHRRE